MDFLIFHFILSLLVAIFVHSMNVSTHGLYKWRNVDPLPLPSGATYNSTTTTTTNTNRILLLFPITAKGRWVNAKINYLFLPLSAISVLAFRLFGSTSCVRWPLKRFKGVTFTPFWFVRSLSLFDHESAFISTMIEVECRFFRRFFLVLFYFVAVVDFLGLDCVHRSISLENFNLKFFVWSFRSD